MCDGSGRGSLGLHHAELVHALHTIGSNRYEERPTPLKILQYDTILIFPEQ